MNGFIGLDKTYRDNTVWHRRIGEIRVIRLPTMNPAVLEDIIRYILFNTRTRTVRMAITLTTTTQYFRTCLLKPFRCDIYNIILQWPWRFS